MVIYKILTEAEFGTLEREGAFRGAPVGLADGYIHLSGADTVRETAAKHFAGRDGLVLAAVDAAAVADALKWEPSRGGALFPHLYRPLKRAEVLWAKPLPLGPEGHVFPEPLGS